MGTALAGTGVLGALTGTASAQNAMYVRDAYVGPASERTGLGTKGWLYFASDTGAMYYHDGSGWTSIIDGSGVWSDSDGDNLYEQDKDGIDVPTVKTDELTISGQTLVRSYQSSEMSISAGTWTTVKLDTTEKDELGEFDTTNHTFTPSETGWYSVSYSVGFSPGADGDRLRVKLYDTTGNGLQMFHQKAASGTSYQQVKETSIIKLIGGNPYDLRVRNRDSSDTIRPHPSTTYLNIRKANR